LAARHSIILASKADCNGISGSYLQDSGFSIELGHSTMAICGEESLDQQLFALLDAVTAGGFGVISAVPLTMLPLITLESIDGTRTLSVLMRFTGKEETVPSANDG
jgi:hypothetical protein